MKYLLFLLLLISGYASAQTTYYIRADSTRLQKVGASNELILENATKAITGVLVNYGNGRTRFSKPRIVGDTLFIGVDTILGVGAASYTFPYSVVAPGDAIQLRNDTTAAAPVSVYYGSNAAGRFGYYPQSGINGVNIYTSDGDLTGNRVLEGNSTYSLGFEFLSDFNLITDDNTQAQMRLRMSDGGGPGTSIIELSSTASLGTAGEVGLFTYHPSYTNTPGRIGLVAHHGTIPQTNRLDLGGTNVILVPDTIIMRLGAGGKLFIPDLSAGAATDSVMVWDAANNEVGYRNAADFGATYTFTNGITEAAGTVKLGGTLVDATTTINGDDKNLIIENATTISISSALSSSLILNDSTLIGSTTLAQDGSRIVIKEDTIFNRPLEGNYIIDSLNYTLSTTGKKILLRDTATGLVENIDPALIGGGTQGLQDVITQDATLTGDNTVVNGANTLTITNDALAGDAGVSITSNSTAAAGSAQKALNISLSGTNSNASETTYGVYVTNSHAGTGAANYGVNVVTSNGGSGNTAILGQDNGSGLGVQAVSNSGTGLNASSTSGTGLQSSSASGLAGYFQVNPTSTNTTTQLLQLVRNTSSTAANDIGLSLDILIETDAGGTAKTANQLISKWTTAADATRTSQFDITGVNSAATETFMNIQHTGVVRVNNLADTLATLADVRAGGGSTSPAGNFGNIQINRNGAFDTPASDSLDFESATGLTVKGNITSSTLTSGRVAIVSTAGLLADDAGMTYNSGTDVLTLGTGVTFAGGSSFVHQTTLFGSAGLWNQITAGQRWGVHDNGPSGAILDLQTGSYPSYDNSTFYVNARTNQKQGADVASVAGAIAVGRDGNTFEITGTNAITLISNVNWANGAIIHLVFTSTATLTDGTANSGTDIGMELAGGANFSGSADDVVTLVLSEVGGTQRWREVSRSVN